MSRAPLLARSLAWIFTALLLLGASAAAQQPVRVASKLDTESALLGSMILLVLQAEGIATVDKLQLGPTNILRSAILSGEIDIYPEYTGNGALFYALQGDPAWREAEAGYRKVAALDREKHGLIWLTPAPADNSWVIAVRTDVALANRLATMRDFADWVRRGGAVKLAASAEFVESPAALPAFEKTYGFHLAPAQMVILAGGDTTVTMRAAAERISGVNAAMAYGTDGALAVLPLSVMQDPAGAQIIYAPAPVVRAAALARFPAMRPALTRVFAGLDEQTLRSINAKVSVEGEAARSVAADYLRRNRLLP
jgi:osmoprotectant transport system substrate-binding protein